MIMSETKVVTGKVRFSYCHVFEPHSVNEGENKKYSVAILIDKKDKLTLGKIEKAVAAAIEAGTTKFGGKAPKNLKLPLRDGDDEREDDDTYAGKMFINASSNTRPGVVDENRNQILDREEFYSGCYGRASINFYAFNTSGNRGIACGLNNLQKLEDGERLSGGSSAEEDFGDEDDMLS
jgi:hypothetical protein